MQTFTIILLGLIAIKSIIGFHFPWEKCDCCGKKYREHKTEEDYNGIC